MYSIYHFFAHFYRASKRDLNSLRSKARELSGFDSELLSYKGDGKFPDAGAIRINPGRRVQRVAS